MPREGILEALQVGALNDVDLKSFILKSRFFFLVHDCQRHQPGQGDSRVELAHQSLEHSQQARHRVYRGDIAVPGSGQSDETEIRKLPLELVGIAADHAIRQVEGMGDG